MSESRRHQKAKWKAAGPRGLTEVGIRGVGRIDAVTPAGRPVEVELSGKVGRLAHAARKLGQLGTGVLKVPHKDVGKANRVVQAGGPATISVKPLPRKPAAPIQTPRRRGGR